MGYRELGGREGLRTPGLLVANEALSQLSYSHTSSNKILANVTQCCQPQAQRGFSTAASRHEVRFRNFDREMATAGQGSHRSAAPRSFVHSHTVRGPAE